MANDGRASINQDGHPARLGARTTSSNRNNASFKIPCNSLKMNAKPNPNRNTNVSSRGFLGHPARATNHNSRITNHTLLPPMSHCYNRSAHPSSHLFVLSAFCEGSLATSHCLFTARAPRVASHRPHFTNHYSPITTHASFPAHVTMLQTPPAVHQSPLTNHAFSIANPRD